jgi:hypothetical protein
MARDDQLALFAVVAVEPLPSPSAKPKKNQQDIRAKQTREEREQDEQAFWSGLSCRVPPCGVPSLWSCFGSKGEQFMCSWCGWSFERRTGAIKPAVGPTARGCPRCPVEHPELRPTRLPVDEDQEELFADV